MISTFRFIYESEIRATQRDPTAEQNNPAASHKHTIRRVFHGQLKHLWATDRQNHAGPVEWRQSTPMLCRQMLSRRAKRNRLPLRSMASRNGYPVAGRVSVRWWRGGAFWRVGQGAWRRVSNMWRFRHVLETNMSWWSQRSQELRTVCVEAVKPFASPFVSLLVTTWAMIRHPVKFGQFVNEDRGGLAGGLAYMAHAVLLVLVVIAVTFRWLVVMNPSMPSFPFIEVVIAGSFVVISLVIWIAFAPFFRVVAGRQLNVYSFVAANSYWVGFLLIFVALAFLVAGTVIGLFCDFGDGVQSRCEPAVAHVGVRWPGWNNLTFGQVLFLVTWVATALIFLAGIVVIFTTTWGLVCWLSKAHGISRLRVVVSFAVFEAAVFVCVFRHVV